VSWPRRSQSEKPLLWRPKYMYELYKFYVSHQSLWKTCQGIALAIKKQQGTILAQLQPWNGTQLPAFVILTPLQYILKQSWQNVTNIHVINCLPAWYHMMFKNKQITYYIKRMQGNG
jgi:hypothetical protein